jgi:hypothetical protein
VDATEDHGRPPAKQPRIERAVGVGHARVGRLLLALTPAPPHERAFTSGPSVSLNAGRRIPPKSES